MNPIENLPKDERDQRVKAQREVMREGELVEGFLHSETWKILRRTIDAQLKNYKYDTQDAAKNRLKDIRAYIGRQEALEWLIQVIEEDFSKNKEAAFREMLQDQAFYQAESEQDVAVHQEVNKSTYPGNRPGFI